MSDDFGDYPAEMCVALRLKATNYKSHAAAKLSLATY
jgi:hypothetical protein